MPEEKYVWDNVENPGSRPERPGPEPDLDADREVRHAWLEKRSVFVAWMRGYRRFTLAQAMKVLHEAEASKDPVIENLRSAVMSLGAITLDSADGGLFSMFRL